MNVMMQVRRRCYYYFIFSINVDVIYSKTDAKMAKNMYNSDLKQQQRMKSADLKKSEDMALMIAIDERCLRV